VKDYLFNLLNDNEKIKNYGHFAVSSIIYSLSRQSFIDDIDSKNIIDLIISKLENDNRISYKKLIKNSGISNLYK
jgi:hypothetical protein